MGKYVQYVLPYTFPINNPPVRVIIDKANQQLFSQDGIICTHDGVAICSTVKPRNLVIPEGVKIIGPLTFNGNDRLVEIKFPSTLKVIEDNGLSQCENLKRVILPEGFERIDVQALMDNINLNLVDLPSTIVALGYETLWGCNNLRTLIIRSKRLLEPNLRPNEIFEFSANCELFVPENLEQAYRAHLVWGKFKSINPL